jgi:hypothetical protein
MRGLKYHINSGVNDNLTFQMAIETTELERALQNPDLDNMNETLVHLGYAQGVGIWENQSLLSDFSRLGGTEEGIDYHEDIKIDWARPALIGRLWLLNVPGPEVIMSQPKGEPGMTCFRAREIQNYKQRVQFEDVLFAWVNSFHKI